MMKKEDGITIITNGTLIDGTGVAPVPDGCVVVKNGRIEYAGESQNAPELEKEARNIDANGGTIMPGLVEAHFHATYFNIRTLEDLDIKYPVEYVSLLASVNCRLALEFGYTAARSGGVCSTSMFGCVKRSKAISSQDHVFQPQDARFVRPAD